MRLPDGREFNGWWIVAAVLLMAAAIGLMPHSGDLQQAQQRPAGQ